MSEVEKYRPLPEKRAALGDRPPRVVLLYLDEAGGHMVGYEWVHPEVTLETEHNYEDFPFHPFRAPRHVGTTYTVTITGAESHRIVKGDQQI